MNGKRRDIKLHEPYLILVNYFQVPKSDPTKMVIFLIATMTENDTYKFVRIKYGFGIGRDKET